MIYKKRSITCYCIFQKNLLPLQSIIHSNQKENDRYSCSNINPSHRLGCLYSSRQKQQ